MERLSLDEFATILGEDSKDNGEVTTVISYLPFYKDGRKIGVIEVEECLCCGEKMVNNVFTLNSDDRLESLLEDLGMRDEDYGIDDDDDEDGDELWGDDEDED